MSTLYGICALVSVGFQERTVRVINSVDIVKSFITEIGELSASGNIVGWPCCFSRWRFYKWCRRLPFPLSCSSRQFPVLSGSSCWYCPQWSTRWTDSFGLFWSLLADSNSAWPSPSILGPLSHIARNCSKFRWSNAVYKCKPPRQHDHRLYRQTTSRTWSQSTV